MRTHRLKKEIALKEEDEPQPNSALGSLLQLVGYTSDPERPLRRRIEQARSLLDVRIYSPIAQSC